MHKKKITKIIFGISVTILYLSSMWFFILVGIANPYAYQKLDMFEKPLNKTKQVIVNYNLEIKKPDVIIHENNDKSISSTINVGSILLAVITSMIGAVVSKLVNKFWPDKKDH